jgi:hypothetical protein
LAEAGGALGSISSDGRYVAFSSYSWNVGGFSDLTPGVGTGFGASNIYVRDRLTGDITLETIRTDGTTRTVAIRRS